LKRIDITNDLDITNIKKPIGKKKPVNIELFAYRISFTTEIDKEIIPNAKNNAPFLFFIFILSKKNK
jgi:hypothetical protein